MFARCKKRSDNGLSHSHTFIPIQIDYIIFTSPSSANSSSTSSNQVVFGRRTDKIASKSQHRTRTSLLGGEQSYQPLHGNSFSTSGEREVYTVDAYSRQGLPAAVEKPKRRLYIPDSRWTIAFTAVVFFQALIALALEAFVFGKFETALRNDAQTTSQASAIPTYLTLFIFGFLYQLGLTYDALSNRNTIQIIGLCLYNYGMLIYAAIEKGEVYDAIQQLKQDNNIDPAIWPHLWPSLIAAPCIIALGSVLMSFAAYKLYQEFAWDIYKSISADLRMRHRFLTYQIYIALLKFDFFFFLGFSVQFLVILNGRYTANIKFGAAEIGLTIAAIPCTIILLFLAAFFCRRESKPGQIFIIFIYFAAMAYFVFKLVRMWAYSLDPQKVQQYLPARPVLTTFAIITIILLVVTITVAFYTMNNFNKGLRPFVTKKKTVSDDPKTAYGENAYSQQLGEVPGRMVID